MGLSKARVIKASDANETWRPVSDRTTREQPHILRAELLEAHHQARAVLERAKAEAEALLQAARNEVAEIRQSARDEGHQEGLASAATRAVWVVDADHRGDERQVERLVAFAKALSERILGRSLALDDAALLDMAKALLREARGARRITLATHPDDVARLAIHFQALPLEAEVRVIGRAALARGDFQLETDLGSLEGRLGSRIELLAERLRQGLS